MEPGTPVVNAATPDPSTAALPPMEGVRFIRVQRVIPSVRGEYYINLAGIRAFRSGSEIRIVRAFIDPPYGTTYGPDKLTDGRLDTFAHTNSSPNASITVELATPVVDEFHIDLRRDCCWDRITGCVVQVLRADGSVIRSWPLHIPDNHLHLFTFSRVRGFELKRDRVD